MRRTRRAGFTLVEMLISLAIMSIVGVVLAETFVVGYTTLSTESRQLAADNTASDASLWLTRDVDSSTIVSVLPVTLTPGSATTIVLNYGAAPGTTVTYSIDSKGNLLRAVSGGNTGVAARGVASLKLALTGVGSPVCDLTAAITPAATGAGPRTLQLGQRVAGCF